MDYGMKFFLQELNFLFRIVCGFFLVALVVALVVAVVSQKFKLHEYRSATVVEFVPSERLGEVGDEQFFRTECEKMVSREVLETIADSENLEKKWGLKKEEVLTVLEDAVSCERVEGTRLARLEVTHHDPDKAYLLADKIPGTYRQWRAKLMRNRMELSLNSLDVAIGDQKDRTENKRKVLDTIVRITGRPFFDDSSLTRAAREREIATLDEEEVVEMSSEMYDSVEAAESYQRAKRELAQLRDKYFLEAAEFVPVSHDLFNSLIVLEKPRRPSKALPITENLGSNFMNALSVTSLLGIACLIPVLFVRSFWWGRLLE